MIYHGHIRNGVTVFDEPVNLPEGTPVRVEVAEFAGRDFWRAQTAEELARDQGVKRFAGPADVAGDWPPEDSTEQFLAFVHEARR